MMTSLNLDEVARAFGMTEQRRADAHLFATVSGVDADGGYQVTLDGASVPTRAARLCDATAGDRVLCLVSGGRLYALCRVGGAAVKPAAWKVEEHLGGIDEWSWTRWSNGLAEAWKRQAPYRIPVNMDWEGVKYSAEQWDTFPPGLFTSVSTCDIRCAQTSGDFTVYECGVDLSTSSTQHFYIARPTTATLSVAFSFSAKGRWD